MSFSPKATHAQETEVLGPMVEIDCRQILKSLPVALYTCDKEGCITFYNDAAAQLWGREPKLGEDLWCGSWKIYRPDGSTLPLDDCPMAVTLREGRAVVGEEIVIERPDGVRHSVLPHPQPIFNDAGERVGAVNMLVDISGRKQIEEEIQAAKEMAEAANRAKDRFLAVLSHEMRTPLTPVLMTVAVMEVDPGLPEAVRAEVGMIRRNVELEIRLIDDLLDLSGIASGKMVLHFTSVDFNAAVLDVCAICRPQLLDKDLHLAMKLKEHIGHVRADPARLRQILWNLLRNAIKFTPRGGDIRVRTAHGPRGQVTVEIRDNGLGIPEEALPHIFDAFGQASEHITRQYGGMGLGLAISKALVELHHGSIAAASEGPGKGSTFTIDLPVARDGLTDVACSAPGKTSNGMHLRLLLVEDHADTAHALCRLLRATGYEVRTSGSAAGAMELMAREPFDLLVSDVGLPDASGYDLMRQVHELYPIKGIAISGYGMDEDIQKSRESGFSDHLVKPIKMQQLERAIQRLAQIGK